MEVTKFITVFENVFLIIVMVMFVLFIIGGLFGNEKKSEEINKMTKRK